MAICAPVISGPLSELSTSVWVEGLAAGATAVVSSIGPRSHDVARIDAAAGGRDELPLLAGVNLRADDQLVVTETLGADEVKTPDGFATSVQPAPKAVGDVGPVGFRSHLYSCGMKVWVAGAIPGAQFEVDFDGETKGTATSATGDGHVSFQVPMPKDSPVGVRQVAAGFAGPTLQVVPEQPPVTNYTLPAASIVGPCMACASEVLVTGILDGASVELRFSDGRVFDYVCDASSMRLDFSPPLTEGDQFVARQAMPHCKFRGQDSASVTAVKTVLGAPVVAPPCAGSHLLQLFNLQPGAVVRVKVGGQTYLGTPPPGAASYAFMFEAGLPAGGNVEVTQELCNVVSTAAIAPISKHENVTKKVTIVAPLLACGQAVRIRDAHPGALVQAFATNQAGVMAPISARVVVPSYGSADIAVVPYLREHDQVTVKQWACSDTPVTSDATPVQAHGPVNTPEIEKTPYSGHSYVSVKAIRGGWIEVETKPAGVKGGNWQPAGTAIALDDLNGWTLVYLNRQLQIGDQLQARVSMCDVCSDWTPAVTVVRPPAYPPRLDDPQTNASGVALKPTFKWHDPGAGTDAAADSYSIAITPARAGVQPQFSQNGVAATQWTPPGDLSADTEYGWTVRAHNPVGDGGAASSGFTTGHPAQPAPPAPVLDSYDWNTHTLTGHNFLPNHQLELRLVIGGTPPKNNDGVYITDGRQWTDSTHKSDAQGKLSVVVEPTKVLPTLDMQDNLQEPNLDTHLVGVVPGETLIFTATDSRPDAHDLTGVLWTPPLNVKVT